MNKERIVNLSIQLAQRMALVGTCALVGLNLQAAQTPAKVDAKIPEYRSVQGVSGAIKSVGSDTLNNQMTRWAESFKKLYPAVTAEVEGKGSTTARP